MNAEDGYFTYGGKEYSEIWLTVADTNQANKVGSL